jgi:hypothetical protein
MNQRIIEPITESMIMWSYGAKIEPINVWHYKVENYGAIIVVAACLIRKIIKK